LRDDELEVSCFLNIETLNRFPLDVILAEPIVGENGELQDFELVWGNEKLRSRGLPSLAQLNVSHWLPHLLQTRWFEELRASYPNRRTNPTVRKQTVFGMTGVPYELTTFWAGDLLYGHVNEIDPVAAIQDGLPHALQIIFKALNDLPFAASFVTDERTSRFASSAFLAPFKIDLDQFAELDFHSLIHDEDRGSVQSWLAGPPTKKTIQFRVIGPNAVMRWIEVSSSPVTDLAEKIHGVLYLYLDVHDTVVSQEALRTGSEILSDELKVITTALDVSRDGFAIWAKNASADEIQYKLEFINQAGALPTGLKPASLVGKELGEVLPGQDVELRRLFDLAMQTGLTQIDVVDIDSETGWVGAYENQVVPLSSTQIVASFRDISDERREKQRLEWLLRHDHLTGLLNRSGLEHRLEDQLNKLQLDGQKFAFAFLDLDNFKAVNDTYGHDAGDRVLASFGGALLDLVEGSGTVARISGDEFAIVVECLSSVEDCARTLERLQHSMKIRSFEAGGELIHFSAGMALVTNPNCEVAEILRVADKAMYSSKHHGKNQYRVVTI